MIATPWHNNKAIISLNDQTNIQSLWLGSNQHCIDRNTGCQIKQLCTQGTGFYVRNWEYTGFGIHRVILYVTSGKIPLDQTICLDLKRKSEYARLGIDRLHCTRIRNRGRAYWNMWKNLKFD